MLYKGLCRGSTNQCDAMGQGLRVIGLAFSFAPS